jgi:glycosyltransferase involved in cell wall biosynthesis
MKRVLIIAYYWPPSAGSGVQRWLKFVKYLKEYGWEPIVYTPLNPDFDLKDERLMAEIPEGIEILKQPIQEPFTWYATLVGKKADAQVNPVMKGESTVNWKSRLALWIRANLFIPDSRMLWIRPSIRFLSKYLKENPVDAMVTTGPPHSMHLIGLGLKKKMRKLPWLADFRDPWTKIDFYHELPLEGWADRRHKRLERTVLVGKQMQEDLFKEGFSHVEVITNGFDPADIDLKQPIVPDKKFTILHIGMLGKARSHPIFWKGLHELRQENPDLAKDLEVHLYGVTDPIVQDQISGLGDTSWVHFLPYVSHEKVIQIQRQARVLLLSVNNVPSAKGIITGKIFEYLAIGRPILCIGPPDGDAAFIVREAGAGPVVGFEDLHGLKAAVMQLYTNWRTGSDLENQGSFNKYSRKELCGDIAKILGKISGI